MRSARLLFLSFSPPRRWNYLFIRLFRATYWGDVSRAFARYAFITSIERSVDIGASIEVAGFDPARSTPRQCFFFPPSPSDKIAQEPRPFEILSIEDRGSFFLTRFSSFFLFFFSRLTILCEIGGELLDWRKW